MKKMKRVLAALSVLCTALAATACGGGESSEGRTKETDDITIDAEQIGGILDSLKEYQNAPDSEDKTICWLSVYDLNPKNNQDRSVALMK